MAFLAGIDGKAEQTRTVTFMVREEGYKMRSFYEIGRETGTDKCTYHGYHVWYDQHFKSLRDKPLTLLEIGVYSGASLRLWEEYFPFAKIYAIDNNPDCLKHASARSEIFIGDQANAQFLSDVAAKIGEMDIVIDDGGHMMNQQVISFMTLFNKLRTGGYYVVEDLETSYDHMYGGGPPDNPGTMVVFLKSLLDDLNADYHQRPLKAPATISEIHLYKTIAFLVKG